MSRISLFMEVMTPVTDYFKVTRKREFVYEWGIPLVPTAIVWLAFRGGTSSSVSGEGIESINAVIVNFSAILVGFSVAALSIISAGSGQTIAELKSYQVDRLLLGKKISLFRLILINFVYLLFIEFIVVLLGVLYMCTQHLIDDSLKRSIYIPIIYLFCHSILLNFRNLTHFYLCHSRSADAS